MAGTWKALTNQPSRGISTMLLLTDGTVMCQDTDRQNWWLLRPNADGDYSSGNWTPLAKMAHARQYYASAVLADGRVFVSGGEYGDNGVKDTTNTGEIYDPTNDTWTSISGPTGWAHVGDAACCVLANGKVLVGSIDDSRNAIFDPATNTWTAAANKTVTSDEETWTLLPDDTVLTVECYNSPNAEKYVPSSNTWVSAGSTLSSLIEISMSEIGPALLLPDGRVFAIGGTGHTALYTPPASPTSRGIWTAGPDFPKDTAGHQMKAKDAPACLLPNGKVLCVAGPDNAGGWSQPTNFFEFDPATSTLTMLPTQPPNGSVTYVGRLLLLPTGEVLYSNETTQVYMYTPDGAPAASWKPVITSLPATGLVSGETYTLAGMQLNGLSQAVSYGDDASSATNYPLVRISIMGTNRVAYARTFHHSSMGVATGAATVSTSFTVPFLDRHVVNAELCVIANGISSDCIPVTIAPPSIISLLERFEIFAHLIGSLADGSLWVLTPHGPVPVDPWGPEILRLRTLEAYTTISEGIRALRAIGREVLEFRSQEIMGQTGLPENAVREHGKHINQEL